MHPAIPALLLTVAIYAGAMPALDPRAKPLPDAVPNDNRTPGGRSGNGAVTLHLEARLAAWRPDLDVDSAVTVQAFAETDGVPRIPGPLLRATSGTAIHLTIRNSIPDSTLVVYGLRAGTDDNDTVAVRPGETRAVSYRAGAPGTYLYWGTTSGKKAISDRLGREGQLTGAIVIDEPGGSADERVFVITLIDVLPDSTKPPPREDIWELAINGRSWPHTERLEYAVEDTARWRWLNGSPYPHPMHLHGFHFRVNAKGTGTKDRTFPAGEARDAVTEFMLPGSTFAMQWVPTRAGNWLMHCHMAPHITPFPARPDSTRAHDEHAVQQHALYGMAGLVLGISTTHRAARGSDTPTAPARQLRLLAQERVNSHGRAFGYVLQQDGEPALDSIVVPGPPLILTRGQTTAITVVNRTQSHTTVHWHGIELESLYDGVAGWSGMSTNLAPLILPGDSFTVSFTPPRAGTYIYHTHMDETEQLSTGMYGPMLVLEPGERFDPTRDISFTIARAIDGAPHAQAINGRTAPAPLTLTAGTKYRLRIINIMPAAPISVQLLADSVPVTWRPISKDGADLPQSLRREAPAKIERVGVGETYDFEWTPVTTGNLKLTVSQPRDGWTLVQPISVR